MTTMLAPQRSYDQRTAALVVANGIRIKRAKLKADIKRGDVNAVATLADPPAYVQTMKVIDLLKAIPKFGPVRVRTVLRTYRVSESKTVGGLSDRQRGEVVAYLESQGL